MAKWAILGVFGGPNTREFVPEKNAIFEKWELGQGKGIFELLMIRGSKKVGGYFG